VTPVMTREVREALRRANGSVTVNVRVYVDANGKVKNTEVVSITGNMPGGALVVRSAAQNAAREWKFHPASLNGKNVPGELVVSFKF
jgi:TonB family protein